MPDAPAQRSYGCSFGDGQPYDFILIDVQSGTTEFLCAPCYIGLARDMLEAITQPDSDFVKAAMAAAGDVNAVPMSGNGTKARGKNAPANNEDSDLIEVFDSIVTVDQL